MDISFRKSDPEEIPDLLVLMQEYYEYDHLTFTERVARKALEKLLGNEEKGCVWFVVCDGEDVGYVVLSYICSLEFHGTAAFIDELYLRESHRGKGIGKRTVEFIEEYCRSQRIDALRLEVERSNTRAWSLYEKLGFEKHDRHLMTRWIGATRA